MSGRIRTLKPEILEDAKVAALSDKEFRLFVASILLADDHGNLRAHPGLVHGAVYWARLDEAPTTTSAALARLSEAGFIRTYVVRDQTYGSIVNWTKHQKVDHPGKPRVPPPSEAITESLAKPSRECGESLAPDLRSPITDHDHRPRVATDVAPEPSGSALSPTDLGSLKEETSLAAATELVEGPRKPAPKATPNGTLTLLPEPTAAVPQSRERQVYEHYVVGWKRVVRGTRPPKFDDKRRGKIRARLAEGYSVDDLKLACDGLWESTWHIEHKAIDLSLVCQDAPHVDRFLSEAAPLEKARAPVKSNLPDPSETLTPAQLAAHAAKFAGTPLLDRFTAPDPGADVRIKPAAGDSK